jgi:chromosome segregation ATPase
VTQHADEIVAEDDEEAELLGRTVGVSSLMPTAEAARRALSRQVELADGALRERDEVIATLETERRAAAGLQARVSELEAVQARLTAELQSATATRDALAERQAAAEEALRQFEAASSELATLRALHEHLQEECATTQTSLREAEASVRDTRAVAASAQQEVAQLRAELAQLQAETAAERSSASHAAASLQAQFELACRERDAAVASCEQAQQQMLRMCEEHAVERQSGQRDEQMCAQLQEALRRCKRSKHLTQQALAWHVHRSRATVAAEAATASTTGLESPARMLFYMFSFWRQLAQRSGRMQGVKASAQPRARPPRPPSPTTRALTLLAALQSSDTALGGVDGAAEDRLLSSLRKEVEELIRAHGGISHSGAGIVQH